MRKDSAIDALECDYVDAGWAETPKGPVVVLRPHPKNSVVKPAVFSLDLQAARSLALNLKQFVEEAEKSGG